MPSALVVAALVCRYGWVLVPYGLLHSHNPCAHFFLAYRDATLYAGGRFNDRVRTSSGGHLVSVSLTRRCGESGPALLLDQIRLDVSDAGRVNPEVAGIE